MWNPHIYTTYSDGAPMEEMVRAAGEADLEGIGSVHYAGGPEGGR